MKNRLKKLKSLGYQNGFGLVDAIVSMSLLAGVITYGIYFSTIRLSTVHDSNLIRSINKEIARDIERLKSDFWSMYFVKSEGEYSLCKDEFSLCRPECSELAGEIVELDSWNLKGNTSRSPIQSWKPGAKRSKVFTGETVLITRELKVKSSFNPVPSILLDKSIANISYRVEWGKKNVHWVSISLAPEAHSWCDHVI